MLVVKTSRVSNVKRLFCLTVALVALVGLGILPAFNWISSAEGSSPAPASARAASDRAGQISVTDAGGSVIVRTATPAFGD
jgi:hypothetical protein